MKEDNEEIKRRDALAGEPILEIDHTGAFYDYRLLVEDLANGKYTLYAAPPSPADAEFKNFHRILCGRFGYVHDEHDWRRDQVSLIGHIAAQIQVPALPDDFESWFIGIESDDDGNFTEPRYLSDEWNAYIARRQLALGAWKHCRAAMLAKNTVNATNGMNTHEIKRLIEFAQKYLQQQSKIIAKLPTDICQEKLIGIALEALNAPPAPVTGINANHSDPDLSPGDYSVNISTKGGAAVINGALVAPALTVINPDEWEPCSPEYLQKHSGACSAAPRVWSEESRNHYHPKNWPAALAVPDEFSKLINYFQDAHSFF